MNVGATWDRIQAATRGRQQAIGERLGPEEKQALKDAVDRIAHGGKTFPRPAEDVVDFLWSHPPGFDRDERMRVTGFPKEVNAVLMVDTLEQVRRLDVLYGAGLGAESPPLAATRQALHDLEAAGWRFNQPWGWDDWKGNADGAYEEALAPLMGHGPRAKAPDGAIQELQKPDQAVAVNYFHGSHRDLGLLEPARAHAVERAVADGMTFRDSFTEESHDPSFAYYHSDVRYPFAGYGGRVMLPFDDGAARDYDGFKRRLGLAADFWQHLPGEANNTDWHVGEVLSQAMTHPYGDKPSLEAVTEMVLAELRRNPNQATYQAVMHAEQWLTKLDRVVRSADELLAGSHALASVVAAAPAEVRAEKIVDDTVIQLVRAMTPRQATPGIEDGEEQVTIGGVIIPRRA